MKKVICLSLVVVFSWLHAYQICDAGEDTIDAMGDYSFVAAHKDRSFKAPSAADDESDTDAFVPQIVGLTLLHSSLGLNHRSVSYPSATHLHPFTSVVLQSRESQDHAPPQPSRLESSPIAMLVVARSPARSLAPPLA